MPSKLATPYFARFSELKSNAGLRRPKFRIIDGLTKSHVNLSISARDTYCPHDLDGYLYGVSATTTRLLGRRPSYLAVFLSHERRSGLTKGRRRSRASVLRTRSKIGLIRLEFAHNPPGVGDPQRNWGALSPSSNFSHVCCCGWRQVHV